MPETLPDHTPEVTVEAPEPTQAPPVEARSRQVDPAHDGIYARVREIVAAADGDEPSPEQVAPLLRRAEFDHPSNAGQRARAVHALQQQYGNRYLRRVLESTSGPANGSASAVMRQASGDGSMPVVPDTLPGGGHALDDSTRAFMESRFGRDFGDVRVHDDGAAHQAADQLQADAFTTGRDIYFNRGQYAPGSPSGQALLAHELAHVAQQDHGSPMPEGSVSSPGDPVEREADALSDAALRGGAGPSPQAPAGGPSISRMPAIRRQASDAAPPTQAPAPTPAAPGTYGITLAGATLALELATIMRYKRDGKISVPSRLLRSSPIPGFQLTEVTIDLDEDNTPVGGTVGASLAIPPLEGSGTLTLDRQGNASGTITVLFQSKKIPGLKDVQATARADRNDFALETDVGFDLPKVTGSLHYKYEKGKHSGKGKGKYVGAKLEGEIEIIMSEAGRLSGSGRLEMELFKGLRGAVDVAVDEKRNVKVVGKLTVPGQVELFPEKKYEKNFFSFEKKFPLWGFTIPVIDVNVGLFAEIHANAGFRAKFGPGVLRNIELTGEFGTDPEAATEFGLGGEFFLPAGAEVVLILGGGIGLGLAVADITGGIEAQGVAGLYTALTVRPNFKYAGGKYTISGLAELAGVAQVKLGINAFAKVDVGVWLFKGTVWRRDWTLAEWIWNTGLNVALRANISYTLGEDFAPDFSFETGKVDPEALVRDVMPESGKPVSAPPKPPTPDKAGFSAQGAEGKQAPEAGQPKAAGPQPPGAPPSKTQKGAPGQAGPVTGAPPGAAPEPQLPPPPPSLSKAPTQRDEEEAWKAYEYDVLESAYKGSAKGPPAMRQTSKSPRRLELEAAYAEFQKKHPTIAISRTAFSRRYRKEYYDDKTNQWKPRPFRDDGQYKVPLKTDGSGEDEPFPVPQAKARTARDPQGNPVGMSTIVSRYKATAQGNRLVSDPRTGREDVRATWERNVRDKGWAPIVGDEEVDHIIELQVGGDNSEGNLQLLRKSDNASSGGTIRGKVSRDKSNAAAFFGVSDPWIKYTDAVPGL